MRGDYREYQQTPHLDFSEVDKRDADHIFNIIINLGQEEIDGTNIYNIQDSYSP